MWKKNGDNAFLTNGLAILLATSLVPTSGIAAEDEEGKGWFIPKNTAAKNFYGGIGVGLNRNDLPDTNQDGSVTGVSTDESGVTRSVFVGYQINENFAVQGGHQDLGESEFSGTSTGGPSWAPGSVSTDQEADGWELGVLGRWPVAPRWYALGYIGMFWWENRETYNESGFISTFKESGSDVTYALGFEFDPGLKDRIVYRFMGSNHQVGSSDVNTASGQLIYRFP